jgi:hypothetical protein
MLCDENFRRTYDVTAVKRNVPWTKTMHAPVEEERERERDANATETFSSHMCEISHLSHTTNQKVNLGRWNQWLNLDYILRFW